MRLLLALILSFSVVTSAMADERLPQVPDPIQALLGQGAQIRYMGERYGLESWITILRGQEQYFYVLPDGEAFVMGLLYDKEGNIVTSEQLREMQEQGDNFLDIIDPPKAEVSKSPSLAYKKPAERMYEDLENSNWVRLGSSAAPLVYAFIDPQCPHCHAFLEEARKDVESGDLQIRAIPVGFNAETLAQASLLLASSNPQERLYNYLDGDDDALPIRDDVVTKGVERNISIMQSWKFDVTPMIAYRAEDDDIKLVRGRVNDLSAMTQDLK